jgi:alpha-D-xyloside xylohydrolase
MAKFRRIVEMRYRPMPYVYAQAKLSAELGYPMLRALFFEHPEDPTCWTIEDEYMFGEDILVAPLMEETGSRTVYLPPGHWIDYQGAATYEGARWHRIDAGEVPAVVLVRHGGVIPRIELAQSTDQMDWSELELAVFGADVSTAECPVCVPNQDGLQTVRLKNDGEGLALQQNPLQNRVAFRIVQYA